MADLLEIEPSFEQIVVQGLGGQKVNVKGLSLTGIGYLIKSHPDLVKLFRGGGLDLSDLDAIINLGTDFTADFLAAGLGYVGDEKAKEKCKDLPAEDIYNIGEAIVRMSFPSGPAAFFQKVQTAFSKVMSAEVKEIKAPEGSNQTQTPPEAPSGKDLSQNKPPS